MQYLISGLAATYVLGSYAFFWRFLNPRAGGCMDGLAFAAWTISPILPGIMVVEMIGIRLQNRKDKKAHPPQP